MNLGKAFADFIIIEHRTQTHTGKHGGPSWWLGAGRALLFTTLLFIALFILLWRLFTLTIVRGHELRTLANGNRTRELIRHAPRGKILDRTGKILADNRRQYRLILPCPPNSTSPCTKLLDDAQREERIAAGLPDGAYLEDDYVRSYPAREATAHVVGYTGEITGEQLRDPYYQLRGYRPGDRIGKMGAEVVYEERLRGRNGKELVEINATGAITRTLGRLEEIPGEDITLSIDRGLSEFARMAFPTEEKGAIIATKPTTGEVLVLSTHPSFDPNLLALPIAPETYKEIVDNPDIPMLNRTIGGVYPPGSTFKIVTAIAALEENVISKTTLFEDIGVLTIGPFSFPNWYFIKYGKTDGMVDIVKALQRSNDIFFYKTGEALGITKLNAWAKRLRVGKIVGIELPGEAAGLMPDPAWKTLRFDTAADREVRNDQWYLGDTYHVSIGQGYLLTTPLQVNSWTNVVANGGSLCKPTIEKKGQECKDLGIKKETIDLITEGMKRACLPGGTGWPLFEFTIPLACKTGTAEFGDPQNRTHAWITVFAPIVEPEISITVLVEGAGEGSDKAAPIAKKILEEWFSR